ncbi:MAG TPA: zf-HC2 domain-containing protein [Thermoleophilaceae bacterium]
MSCREFVELVTDYLENALPADERQRFEEHLALCPGCVTYVDQIRQTVAATGTLREESIPPAARDELLAAFRDWKRG